MNKRKISALRPKSREFWEPEQIITGRIKAIALCRHKINRNRRAAVCFTLYRLSDGKKFCVFVPYVLRERAFAEFKEGAEITAKLNVIPPDYWHAEYKYELKDFSLLAESAQSG